jgi:hypothetical protein
LPSSTAKRVTLYRFGFPAVSAFISPADYLQREFVEFITPEGAIQRLRYPDIKALCFGSDPAVPDLFRRSFHFNRRPKIPGVWVRFTLRDADELDGVLAHNLREWPAEGFSLVPPRFGPSRQRVFIPREAVQSTYVLGVVGSAAHSLTRSAKVLGTEQLGIFDQPDG